MSLVLNKSPYFIDTLKIKNLKLILEKLISLLKAKKVYKIN